MQDRKLNEEPNYTNRFDARAQVATAMAHLGLNEKEAWLITMTGLIGALQSKYPYVDDGTSMTRKEFDEAMEWLDAIDAVRKEEAGIKVEPDGS